MNKNSYYRKIPKVDMLLENNEIKKLENNYSKNLILQSVRNVTCNLRYYIANSNSEEDINLKLNNIIEDIKSDLKSYTASNIIRVINGTGIILHTNLGRAVLSHKTGETVKRLITGYSNLEYDLETGTRGSRYSHLEEIITEITKAEAATAVNNNAAAVLLILSAIAKGKEVLVSRGELVEIGGSFRVPDVIAQSGCTLVEVGTTNKTHLYDFEDAINENTAAILKVHTSNYKIIGFTESVELSDLIKLGGKYNLPVIEDLGSGVLTDLRKFGLEYEPTVQDSIKAGTDIVCFSGDKLLGGPQAGIIIGKKSLLNIIKENPLMRALRIDKFAAVALESVFSEYLYENNAINNIPVLRMINKNIEEIQLQAERLYNKLNIDLKNLCEINIEDCDSQIGGGAMPTVNLKSRCITVKPYYITISNLEKKLRQVSTPIIGRISKDKLILDLRTIFDDEIDMVYETLKNIISETEG